MPRTRWFAVLDPAIRALPEGGLARAVIGGRELCFVRVDGALRALLDVCPHQGRPLSGGWVDAGHVVCPWHRFHFHPVTGESKFGTCGSVQVFTVEESPRAVRVALPWSWWRPPFW